MKLSVTNRASAARLIIYLIAAAVIFSSGWLSHSLYQKRNVRPERRVSGKGYRFTSPLLDIELPEGMTAGNSHVPFSLKVEAYTQSLIRKGRLRDIAVYYRDLHHGQWFAINDASEFNPASMMKVPLMIAWLKRAESDPNVLKRSYLYDGKKDMTEIQSIKPGYTLVKGRRYTVEQLLEFMIKYSDNNATAILYDNMASKELFEVLDGMDIQNRAEEEENLITIHGYSGFFRILYNATFLNRAMSEKALELLIYENFPQGISGGVPQGIAVAAKFGEHAQKLGGRSMQLHEFGIVYHPESPYIIGVMTKGDDYGVQAEIIRDISKMIYSEIDKGSGLR